MNNNSLTNLGHEDSYPETGVVFRPLAHPDEKITLLYTQARTALGIAFMVALVIAAAIWGLVDHTLLLAWIGMQAVQTLVRLVLVRNYNKADAHARKNHCWLNYYICGVFVAGVVWGSLGLIMSVSWPAEYQVFVFMGIAGILAGAVSSYAVVMPVYVFFMLPTIMIPAQALLFRSDHIHQAMGLLCILYAGALLFIAHNYSRSIARSFQLRHDNNRLVKKLEKMNDSLAGEIEGRKLVEADLRRDRQLFTDGVVTVFRWRAEEGWPIEYVSKTISQFGFDAGQLMCTQTKFSSLIHANDLARVEKSEFSNSEHGFIFNGIDYRIVRPDGRIFWVYDYTIPLRNAGGEITHYAGYLLDITDRKQTEVALQHEKDRVDVTLKSIGDAVITIDVNGQIEYINPAAENFTGWSGEVAHGLQLSRIFSLFDEESTALIVNEMQRAITERETVQSSQDMVCNRHDGRRHSVQYSVSPILGHENSVLGAVMVIRDFTEHRSMQHKLSHQETHDVLTGLINRNEFSIRLEAELSYDSENHILCFLNLDELKVINDTCSYAAGDEVIKTIAALLPDQLRDTDVLARLDGDQFGFLLKHCPLKDAVEIAEKILSLVNSATYEGFGESIQTTASIGVARVGSGDAVADVMAMVDLACYAAKELGGNRLHVYHDNDKELAQRHDEMRWVPKIKEAIKTGRLVLYFQDIVPVLSGSEAGCHFELLVRMLDENDELVAPGRFLPAAERYHLVALLDRWVIERSFEWYQRKGRHLGADQPLTMAINLSGESVTDSALLEYIKEEMTYYHVPANVICFEITETAAVANLQAAARFIRDLQHIGCRFALDDFGSGMSSFAYLKNLPVDYLKIDGSLVRGIETDTINYAMVNAIHQLGSVMGIKTIAEFVENERTREKLAEIGVDYAQGFGICRPRPLEDKVVAEQRMALRI